MRFERRLGATRVPAELTLRKDGAALTSGFVGAFGHARRRELPLQLSGRLGVFPLCPRLKPSCLTVGDAVVAVAIASVSEKWCGDEEPTSARR
jgi:hypothetical protein